MFYLVSLGEKTTITDHVKKLKETYKMLIRNFQKKCHGSVTQTTSFDNIDNEGFYFYKHDNKIELREYKLFTGYMYNTLSFTVIGKYEIVEYNKEKPEFTLVDSIQKGVALKKIDE